MRAPNVRMGDRSEKALPIYRPCAPDDRAAAPAKRACRSARAGRPAEAIAAILETDCDGSPTELDPQPAIRTRRAVRQDAEQRDRAAVRNRETPYRDFIARHAFASCRSRTPP